MYSILYQDLGIYKCIYVLFFYVLNKVSESVIIFF